MVAEWTDDVRRNKFLAGIFTLLLGMAIYLGLDALGIVGHPKILKDLAFVDIRVEGQDVIFRTEGVKTTNDVIIDLSATWILSDSTPVGADLFWDEASAPVPAEVSPNRVAGEYFLSRAYYTPIIPEVEMDPGATLRLCYIYNIGIYCVQISYLNIPGG